MCLTTVFQSDSQFMALCPYLWFLLFSYIDKVPCDLTPPRSIFPYNRCSLTKNNFNFQRKQSSPTFIILAKQVRAGIGLSDYTSTKDTLTNFISKLRSIKTRLVNHKTWTNYSIKYTFTLSLWTPNSIITRQLESQACVKTVHIELLTSPIIDEDLWTFSSRGYGINAQLSICCRLYRAC